MIVHRVYRVKRSYRTSRYRIERSSRFCISSDWSSLNTQQHRKRRRRIVTYHLHCFERIQEQQKLNDEITAARYYIISQHLFAVALKRRRDNCGGVHTYYNNYYYHSVYVVHSLILSSSATSARKGGFSSDVSQCTPPSFGTVFLGDCFVLIDPCRARPVWNSILLMHFLRAVQIVLRSKLSENGGFHFRYDSRSIYACTRCVDIPIVRVCTVRYCTRWVRWSVDN